MDGSATRNSKHALITGGSAGLGAHIARACAARGMRLTLVARDADRLAQTIDELRSDRAGLVVESIAADLSVAGEVKRAVEQASAFAPLDLVCHAAGLSARGRVTDTPRADFERLLSINFLAATELAAASAKGLAERKGHFVLIGSLASYVGPPYLGAYPASKHAVAALAQQLRMEWGEAGLHTLLVSPGPLTRSDAGTRYDAQTDDLPASARQPGGGAQIKTIDPAWLADQILAACDRRQAELVVPKKARLLFALGKLWPAWGDWLLSKKMR